MNPVNKFGHKQMYQCFVLVLLWIISGVLPVRSQKAYTLEEIPNVRLEGRAYHVSNPDTLLSAAAVQQIDRELVRLEDSTGIQVAVVAVRKLADNDVRSFATELFNRWGIGEQGKDNGLLLLLVTHPDQHCVVFETGYGLEGDLPDARCSFIQRHFMVPYLKVEDYDQGMLSGVQAVVHYFIGDAEPELPETEPKAKKEGHDWAVDLFLGGLLLLIVILYFVVRWLFCFLVNLLFHKKISWGSSETETGGGSHRSSRSGRSHYGGGRSGGGGARTKF